MLLQMSPPHLPELPEQLHTSLSCCTCYTLPCSAAPPPSRVFLLLFTYFYFYIFLPPLSTTRIFSLCSVLMVFGAALNVFWWLHSLCLGCFSVGELLLEKFPHPGAVTAFAPLACDGTSFLCSTEPPLPLASPPPSPPSN